MTEKFLFKNEPVITGVKLFGDAGDNYNHALRATLRDIAFSTQGTHDGVDRKYFEVVSQIVRRGVVSDNRTGMPTISTFGVSQEYDANDFLLRSKKMLTKSIIVELCWFLRGETNVKYLQDRGVAIWDEWADHNGELGPVYGAQWRSFGNTWKHDALTGHGGMNGGIDQIERVINDLVNNPYSRRHIVTAWNPTDVPNAALPPCHLLFQFGVGQSDNSISMTMYQRSGDIFLGVPFNIASYCILLHMIVQEVNRRAGEAKYTVGKFHHTIADAHLYVNHAEQIAQQHKFASLSVPPAQLNLDAFRLDDPQPESVVVRNNSSAPFIKASVAV